jgi:hypothetical protein
MCQKQNAMLYAKAFILGFDFQFLPNLLFLQTTDSGPSFGISTYGGLKRSNLLIGIILGIRFGQINYIFW